MTKETIFIPASTANASIDNEKELLALLSEGDHAAFKALMSAYYPRLFPFILNITKHYAASEEMLQDVFMTVWEKRQEMPKVIALKPWLFRVAANLALNWLRRAAVEGRIVQQLGITQAPYSTLTQDQLSYREATEAIQRAAEQLPPQQKLIFTLTHQEGMDLRQVAERLNISPHTVRSHLGKAIQTLRSALRASRVLAYALAIIISGGKNL